MKTRIIFPLLAFLVLMGCKKATFLESDVESLTAPISGQTDTITLKSDVNDFKLESFPEWTNTEFKDSVLVVNIGNNDSKSERKGELVISNGDLKLTIPVVQQFKATRLELPDGGEVSIGKDGGTASVAVDCDGEVNVFAPEDLDVSYQNGQLSITAPANEGATETKSITLTADSFSQQVMVTLEGGICPTCNGKGKVKCSSCGGRGYFPNRTYDGDAMYSCTKCGGVGYLYNSDMGGVTGYSNGHHKGSGRITCPTCNGKGA